MISWLTFSSLTATSIPNTESAYIGLFLSGVGFAALSSADGGVTSNEVGPFDFLCGADFFPTLAGSNLSGFPLQPGAIFLISS